MRGGVAVPVIDSILTGVPGFPRLARSFTIMPRRRLGEFSTRFSTVWAINCVRHLLLWAPPTAPGPREQPGRYQCDGHRAPIKGVQKSHDRGPAGAVAGVRTESVPKHPANGANGKDPDGGRAPDHRANRMTHVVPAVAELPDTHAAGPACFLHAF